MTLGSDLNSQHAWREQLKPGDAAMIVSFNPMNDRLVECVVVRVTKTQILVCRADASVRAYPLRYRKSDGRLVGDHGYYCSYLYQLDPRRIAKQKAEQDDKALSKWLRDKVRWSAVPYTTRLDIREMVLPYADESRY